MLRSPTRAYFSRFAVVSALIAPAACSKPQDPPGRSIDSARPSLGLKLPDTAVVETTVAADDTNEPGHGAKIASIAMRTWIYVAPDDRSTKLGYLRAGAVVDRAERSAGDKGCEGGWYRIVPRGYVCVGKGATLALDHQVVRAALRGPDRSAIAPYTYVISRSPPPHLYFRLPKASDQRRTEGQFADRSSFVASFRDLPPPDPVPDFLAAGEDLPKPYGAEKLLHYSVHTGRAREASAFGLITTFEWTERRFGLTTELDLIPLDRTRPAKLSTFKGIVIEKDGIPAFVKQYAAPKLRIDEKGQMHEDGSVPFRSGWVLTGKNNGSSGGLLETTEGFWLPAESLVIGDMREDPAGFARDGKKWISVSIRRQMLIAFEGKRPVFATLVSTGRGELGDPEKTQSTIRGTFFINAKHVSGTMDGEEGRDNYDLRDVPYIQYFYKGFALHGAFWHDDFGKPRSHGCVNLAPADAAWLFEWTDPQVPPEWHGAVNLTEGGTLVYTHA